MGEAENVIAKRDRLLKEEADTVSAAINARLAAEVRRVLPFAVKSLKKRGYAGSEREPQIWQNEPRAVWLLHQYAGSTGRINADGTGTIGVGVCIYLLADGTLIVRTRRGSSVTIELFPLPTSETAFLVTQGIAESLCKLTDKKHRQCKEHNIQAIQDEEQARVAKQRWRKRLFGR